MLFRRVAAAAALAFALTGCGGPGHDAERATLNVYTALEDDELAKYVEAFEAAHPEIELRVTRNSTGIVTAKLLAEKDNPVADVIWGTALTSLMICDQQGMLTGYAPQGLDRIRPSFRDQRRDPPHWVGIKAWMTGFVCNTIELEERGLEPPRSYDDLLKPDYEGLITMPHPASSGTGFLTVSAILQLMGEEEGWAYLDQLHKNIALYTHSGSKPAKLAGKGEFPVGISFAYRGVKQAMDGEPVVTTYPREGSGWDLESNALVKKPAIKDEARTFLDWAIGEDAMRMYARVYPITAAEVDMEVPEGYPQDPEAQLIENDFQWAAEHRERILELWTERFEGKSEPAS
jgi:iron(III) transport system substrate-binding protein